MEESKKKAISIAIVVVCLILAVVIAGRRNSAGGSKGDKVMKCVNEDCDGQLIMSFKDYSKLMKEQFPGGIPMGGMTVVVKCPVCNEQTCVPAVKCEKCETVFFRNTVDGDYPDICPDCGYSALEARSKEN